jgi:hypothetical protein
LFRFQPDLRVPASIAQIGGCSVKLVRRYLKELQTAAPVSGTASGMVREH